MVTWLGKMPSTQKNETQQYTQKNNIYYNIPFFYVEDKHIYRHIETN
jgi:hypothetical protein